MTENKKQIRYKADFVKSAIEKVHVDRETDKFVVLRKGYREGKRTEYAEYAYTWEGAHAALIRRHEERVAHARALLEKEVKKLEGIMGMTP